MRTKGREKKRTTLFAAFAVVLMMISSIAVMPASQSDATESMHTVPVGSDYGYVLKVSSNGMTVADVEVWNGSAYEARTNTTFPGINSAWTFTDGLGPFNCFYAAINITDNTTDDAKERRISNDIGKVAYVLNPYYLQQTIGGTTYTPGIYNIMLVIPTVYWYSMTTSNGTGTYNYTFMSNNPNFFDSSQSGHAFTDGSYTSAVTSSEMVAYAHMFASSGGKDWDNSEGNTTTYPYIALGYYEAYKDTSTSLLSQTDKTPTNNTTIANFRTAAQGNNSSVVQDPTSSYKVGTYGLWNYYGWTLYKLMSITIMDQMDSQYAIGAGKSSGSGANVTGTALNGSKQQWLVTTSTTSTTASVSLLLENAWGSLWENVDDVVVNTDNNVYTNNYLSPTGLSTTLQTTTGKIVLGASGSYSQAKITGLHMDSEVWGMPSAYTGTSVTPASDGSGVNDDAWTSNAQVGCLIVGGAFGSSSGAGLSAWGSDNAVSHSNDYRGARLAYVMTADAAVPEYTITVDSVSGGSASSSSSESVAGQTITITATPTSTSYRLSSLTGVYGTSSESLTFLTKTLTTSTFSMPSGDVTITPAFESISSIAVASEDGSKGSVSISGAYTSTPIYVTTSATYTVVGRAMTISDTILGSTAYTYIVAIPDSGFSYDVFKDQSSYEMSGGSLSSVTSITAYFIVGGSQYSVVFYESASRSTSVAVDKGYSVMLPAADEIAGKEFLGWYSDSSLTSYVGPANSYYTPTGSTLAITLYAKFVDAPDVSGVGEFRVAAFTGANTGAMVQLESASSAGLLAGTLSLGGVYYYETDGIRVYGAITYSNVKVGSTPMTSDWVTVTAGDLKDNVTFSLYHATKTLYVYYAYAQYVYSLDGTNTMTTPGVYGLII